MNNSYISKLLKFNTCTTENIILNLHHVSNLILNNQIRIQNKMSFLFLFSRANGSNLQQKDCIIRVLADYPIITFYDSLCKSKFNSLTRLQLYQ